MNNSVLPKIENEIRRYASDHRGERPLYIVMQTDDADALIREVREAKGYSEDTIVTEVNGTKIVRHLAVKPGEMQLTNELPEASS